MTKRCCEGVRMPSSTRISPILFRLNCWTIVPTWQSASLFGFTLKSYPLTYCSGDLEDRKIHGNDNCSHNYTHHYHDGWFDCSGEDMEMLIYLFLKILGNISQHLFKGTGCLSDPQHPDSERRHELYTFKRHGKTGSFLNPDDCLQK